MTIRVQRHYSEYSWTYPLYHQVLKPLRLRWLWHRLWMRWVAVYEYRDGDGWVRL